MSTKDAGRHNGAEHEQEPMKWLEHDQESRLVEPPAGGVEYWRQLFLRHGIVLSPRQD